VTGRANLECMVLMNYSAGQQINIDRSRPLLQWPSRRRCPQQVLNIVLSTSRPRLAPAVTVGHSLHLTAAPGSPAPCRSLLAVAKSVSHLVPHWRPADDYNGSLHLTAVSPGFSHEAELVLPTALAPRAAEPQEYRRVRATGAIRS